MEIETEVGCTFQYQLGRSLSLTFDHCLPKRYANYWSLQDSIDQKMLLNSFLIDLNSPIPVQNKLARLSRE